MVFANNQASSQRLPGSAKETIKNQLDFNEFLLPHPSSTFLVKVKGDSMIGAGISEGDIVLVDKSLKYKSGDIVVAHIDQESTLKYYMLDEQNKPFLRAANSDYKDMYPEDELLVFGAISAVIRKL